MGFRPLEPRVGVALTAMSLALLLLLKRGSAFRSGLSTAAVAGGAALSSSALSGPKHHHVHHRSAAAGAATTGAAVQSRHTGPEGTDLPDVMHRTVSAEELKVGVVFDQRTHTGSYY